MKTNEKQGIGLKTITRIPEMDKKLVDVALNSSLYENRDMLRSNFSQNELDIMAESTITTNGWDTVFAISAAHLNEAIIKNKTYPVFPISWDLKDESIQFGIKDGKFNAWQICPGGDGRNIHIKLPFSSGTFYYNGTENNIKDIEAIISINLKLFPNGSDNKLSDLKVSYEPEQPGDVVVSLLQLNVPSSFSKSICIKAFLEYTIKNWCENNLDKFNAVFSTINLNDVSQSSDFKWLSPKYTGYAYTDSNSLENSVFGILCMCTENYSTSLPHQITPNALTNDGQGTFIINTALFVESQFLPALPNVFKDSTASDFKLNDVKTGITASSLKLQDVKYGAVTYNPVCEGFEVYFEQSYIRSHSIIRTKISPGIESIVTIETKMTLKLDVNDNKEQIITYEMLGDPVVTSETEVATWVVVTEAVANLILLVVGAVTGYFMEEIVKRVIIGIVVAIIASVISVTDRKSVV